MSAQALARTSRPTFAAWPEWPDETARAQSGDLHATVVFEEIETLTPSEVIRSPRPLPEQLIARYVREALVRAKVEPLEDGSGLYAHVPALHGAWGEGQSESEALEELASAIRDWVVFKMERRHNDIPVLAAIDLNRG